MLVEVIPKEPLSFSVFHYKNPKLQHTVQVETHCIKEQSYFPPKVWVFCEYNNMFWLNYTSTLSKSAVRKRVQVSGCFAGHPGSPKSVAQTCRVLRG